MPHVEIRERPAGAVNGWLGVLVVAACGVGAGFMAESSAKEFTILPIVAAVIILASLVIVQPGQTRVVRFFGSYIGTVRRTGLSWLLPLTDRRNVSIRVRNFETNHLKVNDADGNPVEIAAIVVWQVADTSRALVCRRGLPQLRAGPGRVGVTARRHHTPLRRPHRGRPLAPRFDRRGRRRAR